MVLFQTALLFRMPWFTIEKPCPLTAVQPFFEQLRVCEFAAPEALETGIDNIIRTSIYYCDPMCAWQKPGVEKNHEYIRYILPKGSSFDKLNQWDIERIMNHINSSARASLNSVPPIRLAQLLFDQEAYRALKFREISPDDIILTPDLLK